MLTPAASMITHVISSTSIGSILTILLQEIVPYSSSPVPRSASHISCKFEFIVGKTMSMVPQDSLGSRGTTP